MDENGTVANAIAPVDQVQMDVTEIQRVSIPKGEGGVDDLEADHDFLLDRLTEVQSPAELRSLVRR